MIKVNQPSPISLSDRRSRERVCHTAAGGARQTTSISESLIASPGRRNETITISTASRHVCTHAKSDDADDKPSSEPPPTEQKAISQLIGWRTQFGAGTKERNQNKRNNLYFQIRQEVQRPRRKKHGRAACPSRTRFVTTRRRRCD